MITLKYFKKDECVYWSHIDLLRHLNRTFRRAGFNVKYSAGFNPHMIVKLGVPLPVGVFSSAEYVTVDCNEEPEDFLRRYNEVCVKGLQGVACWKTEKNPSLAAKVVYADYSIRALTEGFEKAIDEKVNARSWVVWYPTRKDPNGEKDIAPLLCGIRAYPTSINVCIDALSMRADVLAKSFAQYFNLSTDATEIWRFGHYVRVDGVLTPVDDYLTALSRKDGNA